MTNADDFAVYEQAMIPHYIQFEEELHHLQHCHRDQCLQQRWVQLLEYLQVHEPLWKQAHELSVDVLRQDEP